MGDSMYGGFIGRLADAGMDVEGTLRRFCGNEALYRKFLLKFLDDKTFEQIGPALEAGDDEQAFQLVHTLKGVSGNLGLTRLYQASINATELLRSGDHGGAVSVCPELEEAYNEVIQILREEDGQE